ALREILVQVAWARRARCRGASPGVHAHHDRRSVWEPRGRDVRVLAAARKLLELRAVGVHDPEIPAAIAIADERNPLPVAGPSRLLVPREPRRDRARRASLDRHDIDVAEHVEGDRPAVGTDVEREIRPFVGIELDRLEWAEIRFARRRARAVTLCDER